MLAKKKIEKKWVRLGKCMYFEHLTDEQIVGGSLGTVSECEEEKTMRHNV